MKSSLKGVVILPCLSGGGAERIAIELASGMRKDQFEMSLCCLKPPLPAYMYLEKEVENAGIHLHTVSHCRSLGFAAAVGLFRYLRKCRPDFVHTHLFGADVIGALVARLAGVRVIISTEHNLNFSEGRIKKFLKQLAAFSRTMTVAVSETVLNYAIQHEGVRREHASVIYNGVKIPIAMPKKADAKIQIGSLGRLTAQKNFSELIRMISAISNPDITCEIAGEGEERARLEGLIAELGLAGRVKLLGWEKNALDFLRKIDIFVMPSAWEGHPLAILEAGSLGLPVIAASIPSTREIISDGDNGLLYRDQDSFIRAVNCLAENSELRSRLGENLRNLIIEKFDIRNMLMRYEKTYESLCSKTT